MALNRCNECSSDFEWHFQLGHHVKRKHATSPVDSDPVKQPEQHACQLCLFCSDNKLSVYEHADVVHKRPSVHIKSQGFHNPTQFTCDHCKYSTNSALFQVRHHNTSALCLTSSADDVEEVTADGILDLCVQTLEVDVHVCTECPFKTSSKDDFAIHQFIHKGLAQLKIKCPPEPRDGEKKSRAPRCNKPAWFNCEYCAQSFSRKEHMRRHIASQHTSMEDIVWYPCEVCPSRYKRKEHLKRHMTTTHVAPEDIVWFKCEVCGQPFKRKEHLKRHMDKGTHVGRRKQAEEQFLYACDRCPAVFGSDIALEEHYHGHLKTEFIAC